MAEVLLFPHDPEERAEPVIIPYGELSPEALRGLLESFVLREGTDYGAREFSLEQKIAHVMTQIERGEAQILFDPNTESVDIVPSRALSNLRQPDVK